MIRTTTLKTGDDETADPTPPVHRSGWPRAALATRTNRARGIDLRAPRRTDDGAAQAHPGAALGERSADGRLRTDRSGQARRFAPGRTADGVPDARVPDGAGSRFQDREPEGLRPVRPSPSATTIACSSSAAAAGHRSSSRTRGLEDCLPRMPPSSGLSRHDARSRSRACVHGAQKSGRRRRERGDPPRESSCADALSGPGGPAATCRALATTCSPMDSLAFMRARSACARKTCQSVKWRSERRNPGQIRRGSGALAAGSSLELGACPCRGRFRV